MGTQGLEIPADRLVTESAGEHAGAEDESRRALVLIVDDEANYADRLEREFEDAGYAALAAHSGLEALASSEEMRPDLIVLDLLMPPPAGNEVLRTVRARFGAADPPVILLTGDVTDRPDLLACVYPNCHVLRKPCSYDDVIRLASELLQGEGPDAPARPERSG